MNFIDACLAGADLLTAVCRGAKGTGLRPAAAGLMLMLGLVSPAAAYEPNQNPIAPDAPTPLPPLTPTNAATFSSGVPGFSGMGVNIITANIPPTPNTFTYFNGDATPASRLATSSQFSPQIPVNTPTFSLVTPGGLLVTPTGELSRGTMTITFTKSVTNPVIHIAGWGENVLSPLLIGNSVAFTLNSTLTPSGVTLTALTPGLQVVAGPNGRSRVQLVTNSPQEACTPAGSNAGCGSFRINGTVLSVTFDVAIRKTAGLGLTALDDDYTLTISIDEDFSDAPASYNPGTGQFGGAPRHVIGDLRLGASIDADRASTTADADNTTSPFPGAGASGDDSSGIDDEDAFPTPPTLSAAFFGLIYTLNVPITAPISIPPSAPGGLVCGWLDFNRNGVFDIAIEQACTPFVPGLSSVPLVWAFPFVSAGPIQARFRIAYVDDPSSAAQLLPVGALDSGEVEDYSFTVLPSVRINKVLSPATDSGTFNLTIASNGSPSYTQAAVGNAGTTGFRSIGQTGSGADVGTTSDISTTPVPITVSETGAGATNLGNYTTTLSCVNGNGAAVTVTPGPGNTTGTFNIPPSSAGGNGGAQQITCTFTNTFGTAVNLNVTKTNTPTSGPVDQTGDTLVSGAQTTYDIVVSNAGPSIASNAVLRDPVPTGMNNCVLAGAPPCTASGTATCPNAGANPGELSIANLQGASGVSIPSMAANSSVTIRISCTVL
jgi:uncharacterized repeat protein (TIGR01451 family)